MTNLEEISAIKARIAKSESDTRTWRDSGYGESSIEAYDDAEAEELHLEAKLAQSEAAFEKNRRPVFRSLNALTNATVGANDGPIGAVSSTLFDDKSWAIRYLVVDTRNWWPDGKLVLVARHWIDWIDWTARIVRVRLTREQVMNSAAYDHATTIDRNYEQRLCDAHKRKGYWD